MSQTSTTPRLVDASKLTKLSDLSGSLGDRVYEAIRDAILSLDFQPGEVIRKEPICSQLGVSRSPVADALKRLAGERLVDIVPQSGTRVSKLSLFAIREEAFIREALEVASAARAAEMRTEQQAAKLARNLRMQEMLIEDGDFSEFYKFDEEFHDLIMECCNISTLAPTVSVLSTQVRRARLLLLPEPGRTKDTVSEHRDILNAIQAGDAEAAGEAMRRHLRQLLLRLAPLEKERPDLFDV